MEFARLLVGGVPQTGAPGRITRRVVGVHVGHYGSDVVSYSSLVEPVLTYCILNISEHALSHLLLMDSSTTVNFDHLYLYMVNFNPID